MRFYKERVFQDGFTVRIGHASEMVSPIRAFDLLMKVLGSATEDEMVLAFLRAEIDSAGFGPLYQSRLTHFGLNRTPLIDEAGLANAKDNHNRIKLLRAVRGYKADLALFMGFPGDVQWHRVELELVELKRLKYANCPLPWTTLSGGSRSVVDGAMNVGKIQIDENAVCNIRAVAAKVGSGHHFPELIVVQGDGQHLRRAH